MRLALKKETCYQPPATMMTQHHHQGSVQYGTRNEKKKKRYAEERLVCCVVRAAHLKGPFESTTRRMAILHWALVFVGTTDILAAPSYSQNPNRSNRIFPMIFFSRLPYSVYSLHVLSCAMFAGLLLLIFIILLFSSKNIYKLKIKGKKNTLEK